MDKTLQYCTACGSGVEKGIPPGDEHPRYICSACGNIHYQNPKLVVGCIPEYQERILLCRRDIEPCRGKWTLPAGFLENGETVREGALRETYEEARVRVEIVAPYRLFDLAFVNQLYLMFRARIEVPEFGPTPESSEVRLVPEREIPWEDIAFPVIEKTLRHYFRDRIYGRFPFQSLELSQGIGAIV
jgi:ADP-ribose pyrophosphatase YjhB (NUDIX family)